MCQRLFLGQENSSRTNMRDRERPQGEFVVIELSNDLNAKKGGGVSKRTFNSFVFLVLQSLHSALRGIH